MVCRIQFCSSFWAKPHIWMDLWILGWVFSIRIFHLWCRLGITTWKCSFPHDFHGVHTNQCTKKSISDTKLNPKHWHPQTDTHTSNRPKRSENLISAKFIPCPNLVLREHKIVQVAVSCNSTLRYPWMLLYWSWIHAVFSRCIHHARNVWLIDLFVDFLSCLPSQSLNAVDTVTNNWIFNPIKITVICWFTCEKLSFVISAVRSTSCFFIAFNVYISCCILQYNLYSKIDFSQN